MREDSRTLGRAAAILGLWALAVPQPLLEVVANSPEFFVARNTSFASAVMLLAVLCVGLPLGLVGAELLVRRVSARAGAAVHYLVVSVLTALMAMPWLERAGTLEPATHIALAAAAALLATALYARLALLRQFATFLAVAALVVPAVFLLDEGTRDAFVPPGAIPRMPPPAETPPIVMVVFDEFPVNSLLDEDGRIDEVRYPNFAALSRDACWFPYASTVASLTRFAVPAIVSGRYPTVPNAVPTLRYYPNNLFTLLDGTYEMHVFGRFLQLCSGQNCRYDVEAPVDTVSTLLADLAVVWLHIVLPEPLTTGLPPIVGDWRGFAAARLWRTSQGVRERNDRHAEFNRFVATLEPGDTPRLYFLHSLLPHMPLEYVPSGRRYDAPDYQSRRARDQELFVHASEEYADSLYQRHLLQVGFVDGLLGRLLARLREIGLYDRALIVVTADHGSAYRAGVRRRRLEGRNVAEIALVPLFVKVPGQREGRIVERNAETVDILPTIASLLAIDLPFEVDGRPLPDDTLPERTGKTFVQRSRKRASLLELKDRSWRARAERSRMRKVQRFGSRTATGLYTVPGTDALLGRNVAELAANGSLGSRIELDDPDRFAFVDPAADFLPLYVRGAVGTTARDPAPLAVAVNGVVAATTLPYEEEGEWVFATVIPEESFRDGANEVAVFLVGRESEGVDLMEAGKE